MTDPIKRVYALGNDELAAAIEAAFSIELRADGGSNTKIAASAHLKELLAIQMERAKRFSKFDPNGTA